MKYYRSKMQVPGKLNRELREDLQLLQLKISGGVSVYKNKISTYQRRPKHPKNFEFAYEVDPQLEQGHTIRNYQGTR